MKAQTNKSVMELIEKIKAVGRKALIVEPLPGTGKLVVPVEFLAGKDDKDFVIGVDHDTGEPQGWMTVGKLRSGGKIANE